MIINIDKKLPEIRDHRREPEWENFSRMLPKGPEYKLLGRPEIQPGQQIIEGPLDLYRIAYSGHIPFRLAPHDIWFTCLVQIAQVVKKNSKKLRGLFTSSDEKINIVIPTGDAEEISTELLIDHLHGLVPSELNRYLLEFSTSTEASRLATQAALLDQVQYYYDYKTFMCGISKIDLTGTAEDWSQIIDSLEQIRDDFASLGVDDLLVWVSGKLIPRINFIINTIRTGDTSGWEDFFTLKNVGSGGQLKVSGWICDFFREIERGTQIEGFPHIVASFPYSNLETGRRFQALYGAFLGQERDGFLEPEYTNLIWEIISPEEPAHKSCKKPEMRLEQIKFDADQVRLPYRVVIDGNLTDWSQMETHVEKLLKDMKSLDAQV